MPPLLLEFVKGGGGQKNSTGGGGGGAVKNHTVGKPNLN